MSQQLTRVTIVGLSFFAADAAQTMAKVVMMPSIPP